MKKIMEDGKVMEVCKVIEGDFEHSRFTIKIDSKKATAKDISKYMPSNVVFENDDDELFTETQIIDLLGLAFVFEQCALWDSGE